MQYFLIVFSDKIGEGEGIRIVQRIPDLEPGVARIGEGIHMNADEDRVGC